MIHHVWTAICHESSIDRDTNNITLYRVFMYLGVTMPRPPEDPQAKGVMVASNFHVVTCWGRPATNAGDEAVSGKARMVFIDPDGEELLSQEYDVNLMESRQHHQRAGIKHLPLTRTGRYGFRIDVSTQAGAWEPVADAPLDVEIHWTDPDGAQFEKRAVSFVAGPADSVADRHG
jgi:hypothetical protein